MPNTAPDALAALLPIPLPALMCLYISISNPKLVSISFKRASAATPATLDSVSRGKSAPSILVILTPFC